MLCYYRRTHVQTLVLLLLLLLILFYYVFIVWCLLAGSHVNIDDMDDDNENIRLPLKGFEYSVD